MDWLTFVAKLVEALAWPVASVVLVFLLREQIKQLIPHIKRFKAGPVEAEFERQIAELTTSTDLPAVSAATTPEREVLLRLVQVEPRAAVMEAWRGIEQAASVVIRDKGIYVPDRDARSPYAVIRALARDEILNSEEVALYHDLRSLRNQAAHAPEFAPTVDAALSYLELAAGLRQKLEAAAK